MQHGRRIAGLQIIDFTRSIREAVDETLFALAFGAVLAVVTVFVCAFFTSFTGASGVTILALGGLLMPVLLAAATTVLGVIPLLQDVFWVGLAVTIMGGLAFGTILTMIMVPTLYATFYRIQSSEPRR